MSKNLLSHMTGSNRRPTDYKSVALPAELMWHLWCGEESNLRHRDFQSLALPTELPHRVKIMAGFPLHPTLYCFLSFTSARQRELISLTQTRLSTAYLEKPIIFVAYVGFEPKPTIHALLVTCTRAHDCTVLSKSTLCILKVTIHRNAFLFQ